MRYVAAYLLAVLGGNENPSSGDIEKILSSVGIEAERDQLNKVIKELNGKDIDDIIADGKTKLSAMPSGGGGAVVAAPAASAAPAAPAEAAAAEPAKEETKAESEESDDDMGFGLFD